MDWSKTKNVLIMLLILANLIVGGLYVGLTGDKLYIPESAVADAMENLASRGVEVSHNAINEKKQGLPVYSAAMVDAEQIKERLIDASRAFGEFDDEPVVIDVPDGISVSKHEENGGQKIYSATFTGTTTIEVSVDTNKDSTFRNSENSGIIDVLRSFVSPEVNLYAVPDGENAPTSRETQTAKSFYKALYDRNDYGRGKADMGFRCYDVRNLGRGRAMCCVATADDIVIPELKSVFWFGEDGKAVYAVGKFFVGGAKKAYSTSLLDGIDVIYKMELSSVKRIVSQHDALSLVPVEGDSYYLIPSHSVVFEDKDGNLVNNIYDSVVGELKSSEIYG